MNPIINIPTSWEDCQTPQDEGSINILISLKDCQILQDGGSIIFPLVVVIPQRRVLKVKNKWYTNSTINFVGGPVRGCCRDPF